MTEMIDSNEILEVNDDKIVTHLLIDLKHIVKVEDPWPPFRNKPHSTRTFFSEINVRGDQYKTEGNTYKYF